MINKILTAIFSFLLLLLCLPILGNAEILTIGGTGSSGPLVKILFDRFQDQNPSISLKLINPPLGSNGALKALKEKRIDIAVAGRPIRPHEISNQTTHFKLASTPFIMCSPNGIAPNGFTTKELANIYDGNQQKWPSGDLIRLIIRGRFESDSLMLKSMSPIMAAAIEASFTRPGMATPINDIQTVEMLAKTPNSLGPTTMGLLSTLNIKLNVFPLNGITPSIATIQDGSYPWAKDLTVILSSVPSRAALKFAEFLHSVKAQNIMREYSYLPATK